MSIRLIICLLVCIVGVLLFISGINDSDKYKSLIGFVLTAFGVILGIIEYKNIIIESVHNQAVQMIEEGAEVYPNGQLVDGTKIDLQYHHITIEEDYILLTPKNYYPSNK